MLISYEEIDFDEATVTGGLDPGLGGGRGEGRAEGIHVSNIIRDLENKLVNPGERPARADMSSAERARMGKYAELGFIWEIMVKQVMKPRMLSRRQCLGVVEGVEIELDGVYMNPDAFCIVDDTLEEYKATWKSSRRGDPAIFAEPENFWSWVVQTRAYCAGYSAVYKRPILNVRMFVFFVNGDYKDAGPQVRMYRIEYTKDEVAETWAMLRKHAGGMR